MRIEGLTLAITEEEIVHTDGDESLIPVITYVVFECQHCQNQEESYIDRPEDDKKRIDIDTKHNWYILNGRVYCPACIKNIEYEIRKEDQTEDGNQKY